jgi:hypothetical protein
MKNKPPFLNADKLILCPRRYSVISQCLECDIFELSALLSKLQANGWNPSEICAIDETILTWLGEGENWIFIHGKPHPRGLMLNLMATFSDKLGRKPYILGILPHWGHPKPKPMEAVSKLMESFTSQYSFSPHVVLDARFAKSDFIGWIEQYCSQQKSGGATYALPCTHMSELFSLLSKEVCVGEWRAATTPTGRLASFKRSNNQKGDMVEWRVLSWGWSVKEQEFVLPKNPFSLKEFNLLKSFSQESLSFLAMKCGLLGEGDKEDLSAAITGLTECERRVMCEGLDEPKKRAEKCKECEKDKLCKVCEELKKKIEEGSEDWTEEELNKMLVVDLDKVCGQLGLKKIGNKEVKKRRILLATNLELLENIERAIFKYLGDPRKDKADIHKFYKTHFSAIDKANQGEFGTELPGRCHSESTRMIHGLLKIPITNVNCIMDFVTDDRGQKKIDPTDIRLECTRYLLETS